MDRLEPVAAGVAVDRRASVKSSRSTVATLADLEAYFSRALRPRGAPALPGARRGGRPPRSRTPPPHGARAEHAGRAGVLTFPVRVPGTETFLGVRARLLRDGFRRLLVGGEVRAARRAAARRGDGRRGPGGRGGRPAHARRGDTRGRLAAALEQAWAEGHGEAHLWIARPAARRSRAGPRLPGRARAPSSPRGRASSPTSRRSAPAPRAAASAARIGIDWAKVIPDEALSIDGGALRPWTGQVERVGARAARPVREGATASRSTCPGASCGRSSARLVLDGEGTWRGGKYPGVRAWFKWLESRTYKMHVRVLLARYRAYDALHHLRRRAPQRRRRSATAWAGSTSRRGTRSSCAEAHRAARRARHPHRAGRAGPARAGQPARLPGAGRARLPRARPAERARSRAARRSACRSPRRSAPSLTGALFVLDEPTVGLHPARRPAAHRRDARARAPRATRCWCIEHDPALIRARDRVARARPRRGPGGRPAVLRRHPGRARAPRRPAHRRVLGGGARARPAAARARGVARRSRGARANNLADVDVRLPLGVARARSTGPSGSGKSTLAEEIVYRAPRPGARPDATSRPRARSGRVERGPAARAGWCSSTSRRSAAPRAATPATYTKAWDRVPRRASPPSRTRCSRGLGPAHFSFNVAGGRCEACSGEGNETVEMQFLADVALTCPTAAAGASSPRCSRSGSTGHSVADVLAMTVDEALAAFGDDRAIAERARAAAAARARVPAARPAALDALGRRGAAPQARPRARRARRRACSSSSTSRAPGSTPRTWPGCSRRCTRLVDGGRERAGGRPRSRRPARRGLGHRSRPRRRARRRARRRGGHARGGRPRSRPATGEALRAATAQRRPSAPARRQRRGAAARWHRGGARPRAQPRDVSCAHPARQARGASPARAARASARSPSTSSSPRGSAASLETLTPVRAPVPPHPAAARRRSRPRASRRRSRSSSAPRAPARTRTVATVTEVAHYLRLLFAKVGDAALPEATTRPSRRARADAAARRGCAAMRGSASSCSRPRSAARKGTYLDVFTAAARAGVARGDRATARASRPTRRRSSRRPTSTPSISSSRGRLAADARRPRPSSRRSRWGKGAVKVLRGRRRGRRARAPLDRAQLPAVRHRRPRARPALVLVQHQAGPLRGLRGHRASRAARGDGRGADRALPTLRGDAALAACRARCGSRASATTRSCSSRSVAGAAREVRRWSLRGRRARASPRRRARRAGPPARVPRAGRPRLPRRSTAPRRTLSRRRDAAPPARRRSSGAGLTGALYVLDEPTIGLHPRDTGRLLENLRALVDTGTTVLVVEHDARHASAPPTTSSTSARAAVGTAGASSPQGRPRRCSPIRGLAHRPRARELPRARRSGRSRPPARDWLELDGRARAQPARGRPALPARPDDGGRRASPARARARWCGRCSSPRCARRSAAPRPPPGPFRRLAGDRRRCARAGGGSVAHRPHAA